MSVSKINGYARIQGKTSSLATAKLTIFATDILWESCSKYDFKQLFHSMSVQNMAILAVAKEFVILATNHANCFVES